MVLQHVALEKLCTAWDNAETSLALGLPKLSVAGDEEIEQGKAWKRLNNSAQKEPSPESIRSARDGHKATPHCHTNRLFSGEPTH